MSTIVKEIQDLTYLRWSHIRSSSGTAGTFLKSSSSLGEEKEYYKLSNFDPVEGVIGPEWRFVPGFYRPDMGNDLGKVLHL